MLNGGISSIPFYERHGYKEDMFNDSEIQSMKVTAAMAKGKYEDSLETIKKKNLSGSKMKTVNVKKKEEIKIDLESDVDEKELDELLNLVSVEKKLENIKIENIQSNLSKQPDPVPKAANEVRETKEDMLNWLDDILDD